MRSNKQQTMASIRTQLIAMTTGTFFMMPSILALPVVSAAPTDQASKGLTDAELAKVHGEVGIAVVDTARKKQFLLNQDKPFPMQSVCQLPISIAILRLADAGKLSVK